MEVGPPNFWKRIEQNHAERSNHNGEVFTTTPACASEQLDADISGFDPVIDNDGKKEGEGDPADAGEGLEAEAEDADGIAGPFEAGGEEAEGDAEEDAGGVAEEEAFGGDPEGGEEDAAEGVIELEAGGITDMEMEEEFGEARGVCEEEKDFGGGRDEDGGPAFGGDHEVASVVPEGEEGDEKEEGVEEASHGEINRRRGSFRISAISGRG